MTKGDGDLLATFTCGTCGSNGDHPGTYGTYCGGTSGGSRGNNSWGKKGVRGCSRVDVGCGSTEGYRNFFGVFGWTASFTVQNAGGCAFVGHRNDGCAHIASVNTASGGAWATTKLGGGHGTIPECRRGGHLGFTGARMQTAATAFAFRWGCCRFVNSGSAAEFGDGSVMGIRARPR